LGTQEVAQPGETGEADQGQADDAGGPGPGEDEQIETVDRWLALGFGHSSSPRRLLSEISQSEELSHNDL